jgi:hypothetical protein
MTSGEAVFALGNLVIAGIVANLAYQQHQLSKRQAHFEELTLKHELYDKRFAVYRGTFSFIAFIVREARIDTPILQQFYHDTADCDFLFRPEIRRYIDHLYSTANQRLRNPTDPMFTNTLMFFGDQLQQVKQQFAPYLSLYDASERQNQD